MATAIIDPVERQVENALVASAHGHRCPIWVASSAMTAWASETFDGAKIDMTIQGKPSADLDAWIAMLPDATWAIRGHLIASLDVVRTTRNHGATVVDLEIMTVRER